MNVSQMNEPLEYEVPIKPVNLARIKVQLQV